MATLGLGLVALLWPSRWPRSFRMASNPSKAKRVPQSMNGDGDELWLLEKDIVVHEPWWCCGLWATDCGGRGQGGEVGTTGRCGCGGILLDSVGGVRLRERRRSDGIPRLLSVVAR